MHDKPMRSSFRAVVPVCHAPSRSDCPGAYVIYAHVHTAGSHALLQPPLCLLPRTPQMSEAKGGDVHAAYAEMGSKGGQANKQDE